MAEAAVRAGVAPREISFKGCVQILFAFQPFLSTSGVCRAGLIAQLLAAIGEHRVGDRPDRYEPRAVKRRPNHYPSLQQPRHLAKAQLAKGLLV